MDLRIASLSVGAFAIIGGVALLNTTLTVKAEGLGFGGGVIGLMTAAYFGGYLGAASLGPRLIGRVGHIRFFAACGAGLTVAILTHDLTDRWEYWIPLRFVSGVAALGMYLAFESWLNVALPNDRRGTFFALYVTLTLVAIATGQLPLLIGEIESTLSWAAILVAGSIIPFALTRIDEPIRSDAVVAPWRTVRDVAPLGMVGGIAGGVVTGSLWGLGPLFFLRSGLSVEQVSLAMIAVIMGGASLQWLVGRYSDRTDRRQVIAFVGIGGGGLALTMIFAETFPLLLATGFVFGAAGFSLYGLSVAHMNDYVSSDDRLGAAQVALTLFGWGSFLGPLMSGGAMWLWGPAGLPLSFAVAMGSVGLYAVYRIGIRLPAPEEERSTYYPMARTSPAVMEIDPRTETDEELPEGATSPVDA